MRKGIIFIIMISLLATSVMAGGGDYMDYISLGFARRFFCLIDRDCTLNSLTVKNLTIDNGTVTFINKTVININVTGNMITSGDVTATNFFGNNSQAATFIVAANDSLHRDTADFICTGTNDDVCIEAALGALPSGGGKIVLLEGDFNLGSEIDLISNVFLEGQGKSTIINNYGFLINNDKDITLSNFFLKGNLARDRDGIIFNNDNDRFKMDNLILENWDIGVLVIAFGAENEDLTISNSIFRNIKTIGIWSVDDVGSHFVNNKFIDIGLTKSTTGLRLDGTVSSIVQGNIFRNVSRTGLSTNGNSNVFIGNTFDSVNRSIFLSGVVATDNLISSNTIKNGINLGVLIQALASRNMVIGNRISVPTGGAINISNFGGIPTNMTIANNNLVGSKTFILDEGANTTITANYPGGSSMEFQTAIGQDIKMKPYGTLTATITPNLYNIHGNVNVSDNITLHDRLIFSEINHFISKGYKLFGGLATEMIAILDLESHPDGEIITATIYSPNDNLTGLIIGDAVQVGRNNSYSIRGNSQGVIRNDICQSDRFNNGTHCNMTAISDYLIMCNEFNKTEEFNSPCEFFADTAGRGGPLLWTQGDLEVWREANIMEGIRARLMADFIDTDVVILNGSFHSQIPVNCDLGTPEGTERNLVNERFLGHLGVFNNLQVDAGDWHSKSDARCDLEECANANGIDENGNIIMQTNFSTLDFNQTGVSFVYSLTNMKAANSFSVTINNNSGSGDVTLFTDTTDDVLRSSQFIPLDGNFTNVTKVSLNFICDVTKGDRLCFVDTVVVNGTHTTNSTFSEARIASENCFGEGIRGLDGRCEFGEYWEPCNQTLIIRGNITERNIITETETVLGDLTVGENIFTKNLIATGDINGSISAEDVDRDIVTDCPANNAIYGFGDNMSSSKCREFAPPKSSGRTVFRFRNGFTEIKVT